MGRIICVGDRFQSIYGFRGADITAIPNLLTMMQKRHNGCKVFPLSTCRRSPRSHIRLAQAIVPDIRWAVKDRDGIDAPEGEIYQVSDNIAMDMFQAGDMGIARTNKVLIPMCYGLIRMKKKCVIRGRDIGKGLLALINKLKPSSMEDLLYKLNRYCQRETRKMLIAEGLLDKDDSFEDGFDYLSIASAAVENKTLKRNAQKWQNMMDKVGCVEALMDGVEDLTELRMNIEKIFAEFDDTGKPVDAIVLGTVHRTKGLEANNVTVLDPENFPHKMASRQWEIEQERNLAYVAATRAKFQLDDKGNVVQPGRLIFIGACPGIYQAGWLGNLKKYPAPGIEVKLPETIIVPEKDTIVDPEVQAVMQAVMAPAAPPTDLEALREHLLTHGEANEEFDRAEYEALAEEAAAKKKPAQEDDCEW